MTTDFETELKHTLRDLAEEVGPVSPSAASNALRSGVKIRYRRQGMFAVSMAAILVVIAASTALAIGNRTSTSTDPGAAKGTTAVSLIVSDRTDGQTVADVQHTLTARFTKAGIRVLGVRTVAPGQLRFSLRGNVPAARLTPLIASNNFEIRAVLKATTDISTPDVPLVASSDGNPTLAGVEKKLGPAYAIGAAITDPSTVTALQAHELAPFADLSPAEVGVLPPAMQYAVPVITCAQLDARPNSSVAGSDLRNQVVACGNDGFGTILKYLLDSAAVTGIGQTGHASTTREGDLGWVINLTFGSPNQAAWTQLTSELYHDYVDSGDQTYRQAAFILDTNVLTAPTIEATIPGPAIISGKFTKASATAIAGAINAGPLHASVSLDSVHHVN